ncbi:MAG TPA: enolase C-terminal domain-like protein [Pirellulales bacterium]|nr:enolase C-terminal domain-like protein [Pirellulales bacterium]
MSKTTDIRLLEVSTRTESFAYRAPVKFGGRVVSDAVILDVTVDVETRDGRRARGLGSMPMGNVWAWPTAEPSSGETLTAMIDLGERLAQQANAYSGQGHPLEITHDLSQDHARLAEEVARDTNTGPAMPRLAQLVAASPLEAAIHDAYGKALGQNSYNVLGAEFVNRDLSSYLTPEFAGEYLDRYTLRTPKPRMPLYHLIGALDPLSPADVKKPLDDGLPETLGDWITENGLTHLKIKLNGDDLGWDVDRVVAVEAVAVQTQRQRGCQQWFYSLDFNEKCANVQYILDFMAEVRRKAPAAFDRVQYIEQPTHRDLRAHPENRMHEAAKIKPMVIDESLVDLESLQVAREQGYTGAALKACKGHSEALLMGAAAQKYGLFLCVQDLTCPGASFLHSASLAARIPTVAAVEGNARQYCPAGNANWAGRYPGMFRITDGTLETGKLDGDGLGY